MPDSGAAQKVEDLAKAKQGEVDALREQNRILQEGYTFFRRWFFVAVAAVLLGTAPLVLLVATVQRAVSEAKRTGQTSAQQALINGEFGVDLRDCLRPASPARRISGTINGQRITATLPANKGECYRRINPPPGAESPVDRLAREANENQTAIEQVREDVRRICAAQGVDCPG